MSSWKDWNCIAVNYIYEQQHREIAQYLKKYIKRKGKRVVEQGLDRFESYFYIKEDKVLTYVLLRWGNFVERVPTFNESKEQFKKEDKEYRKRDHESARQHREDINRILGSIKGPVDDWRTKPQSNNTQTFAVQHQGPYTNFDIEANYTLHDLGV